MHNPAQTFLLSLTDPPPLDLQRQVAGAVYDWQEVLSLAARHDIIPLLNRSLNVLGDAIPSKIRELVRVRYANEALHTLQLDNERRRLTELLLATGIPVIPWKGPMLAELLYGDKTLRPCADIDLLVPPALAWRALQTLVREGYSPGFYVSERRWPALRRAVNHLALEEPQRHLLVELHWSFFHPMHVWDLDLSAHWAGLAAGGTAREGRLTVEETLVLLCAHGTNHCWEKLKWVVDLDRLLHQYPDLDGERSLFLADRMGGRRALFLGLQLAREACGTPLPETFVRRFSRDRVVERLAAEVQAGWFTDPSQRNIRGEYLFQWQSRERLRDRLIWVARQLFVPRLADWQIFPLGSRCYPLFYLERPLRMVWKWGVRPVFTKFED